MGYFCRDVATKKQDLRVLIQCFTIKNESNMLSHSLGARAPESSVHDGGDRHRGRDVLALFLGANY